MICEDDVIIAGLIREIRNITEGIPTLSKITLHYNILVGLFRLCSVFGEKKEVIKLAKDLHEALIEDIENFYE